MAGKKQLVDGFSCDEVWLSIPGFEGYEASDMGRIRVVSIFRYGKRHALKVPRLLRPDVVASYQRVRIGLVHRLVLFAFKGLPNKGMQTLHGNGNRLDNRPENLRWGTAKENIAERASKGEKNGFSRFTEKDIREIRETYRRTSYRQSNVRELMARFNADRSTLLNIIRRKSWAHI